MEFLEEIAVLLDELERIRELSKLERPTDNIIAKEGTVSRPREKN